MKVVWYIHLEAIKEVLSWAINKYFQFSITTMLVKTVVPLSYQSPFKCSNYIVYVAMWSLVTVIHNRGLCILWYSVWYRRSYAQYIL